MKVNHLLFGAAYYDEYMPYDRLDQDMALMQKAGMNVIRIAESTWSTLEPKEGVYDFTPLDRMLTAAMRHGIEVIIGTPTYAIPTWLVKKSTDILAFTNDGQQLYGHRQNMDITSPIYLKYAEKIIRVLMNHIQDYPNIIGFQIDNETHPYGTAGPRAQQLFVSYLHEKYPDINEFNHEFGLDYWSNRINDWSDFPDIRGTINGSLAAEYEKFQRKLVTDFFEWQANIIQKYKHPNQFITHNFDFEWHGTSYGLHPEVNQFEASKCMTVAGCDIYHPSQDDLTGAEITMCGNIIRGLKKDNYLVLETQAQGNISWLPYPGQLRLCAYSHIANGANSVMYWHWHSIHNAIESYWKGVLSHDFSENETYTEAITIGQEFIRYGSHLKNLTKKNQIAIMVDNQSLTGMKQFPFSEGKESCYNSVVRWLGDALYRANLEYDIIAATDTSLGNYDMIIIPALYSASECTLQRIQTYVENGGHIIATFKSGFADEQIKIYADTQPHILHKCLGITYNQFTIPKNVSMSCDFAPQLEVPVLHDWMELITPDAAVTLAKYVHPAWSQYASITQNAYGNGTAYYLGCFFDDTTLDSFLSYAMNQVGILVPNIQFPVIIKHGTNEYNKHIYYYFNYSSQTQTIIYDKEDGILLLENKVITHEALLKIEPWGLAIIEL